MTNSSIIKNETGVQKLIGYVLDVGHADKRTRCHLELTDEHLNRHGVLHGGIASTMLDNALGAAASLTVDEAGRVPFLTISLNLQYMAPAYKGAVVTAIGEITGGGRSILFAEGELRDEKDRLIATATGVFKRVPDARLQPKEKG